MDYRDAYQLLKEKFPNSSAGACTISGDLYMFNMVPDDLVVQPGGVGFYDNMWGVNKNTGEMIRMPIIDNLERISQGELIEL